MDSHAPKLTDSRNRLLRRSASKPTSHTLPAIDFDNGVPNREFSLSGNSTLSNQCACQVRPIWKFNVFPTFSARTEPAFADHSEGFLEI